jgi:nondiscriminating aspartyl-tRNA synthetase
MRVLCADLGASVGQQVLVQGWVHRIRDLGKITFIILRDRSGSCQAVFDGRPSGDDDGSTLSHESVVAVRGTVVPNEKAVGGFELQDSALEVLSRAAADLPLAVNQEPSKYGLEAVLDHRMISLRNPQILSIFRLQAEILNLFAQTLRSDGFTEIKTSKLIGTGTEGGTGLFEVQYFDRKVYLAQSPQLYKQAMVASGLERVFEIGMAYRAEKHDTPRHINEYVSLDIEMAFIETEHDLMDLEQRLLSAIFGGLADSCGDILATWGSSVPSAAEVAAIPRIDHDQAKELLRERGTAGRVFEINPEGERELCLWAQEQHGVPAVFVYGDPQRKRPFYTYPAADSKTMSFDLLFRGLEITTGGRRINDHAMLVKNIERFGLDAAAMHDYLQVFRFGCPPHGGFAIGLERLTQQILGLANVKEASLFPRDRRRVTP